MDEPTWLSAGHSEPMIAYVLDHGSPRKLRLFMAACWSRRAGTLRTYKALRKAVARAEELADDSRKHTPRDEGYYVTQANPRRAVPITAQVVAGLRGPGHVSRAVQADLLREIFGNPFRPAVIDPYWRAWNDGAVIHLAQAIYDERAFDRLPILADALEDAGCALVELLAHLRGAGPHVRGCWVLDRLLGKE